jgi:hypothetical protein
MLRRDLPAAKCCHGAWVAPGYPWTRQPAELSWALEKKDGSQRTLAGSERRPARTIRLLPRLKNGEEITDFVFGFGRAFHGPADLGQEQLAIILAQTMDCLSHCVLREGQFGGGRFIALAVFALTGEEGMQGLEDFAFAGLVVSVFLCLSGCHTCVLWRPKKSTVYEASSVTTR